MKPIKILLDYEQSEILTDAGADVFLVIGRGSWPGNPNRWQLWIVPSTVKQVDAAVRVATGQSTERRSKPSAASS
jgi:hypothetical protein